MVAPPPSPRSGRQQGKRILAHQGSRIALILERLDPDP